MNMALVLVLDALLSTGLEVTHHELPGFRLATVARRDFLIRRHREIIVDVNGKRIRPQHPACGDLDCDNWDHFGHTICLSTWRGPTGTESRVIDLTAAQFGHFVYTAQGFPFGVFDAEDLALLCTFDAKQMRKWLETDRRTIAYDILQLARECTAKLLPK